MAVSLSEFLYQQAEAIYDDVLESGMGISSLAKRIADAYQDLQDLMNRQGLEICKDTETYKAAVCARIYLIKAQVHLLQENISTILENKEVLSRIEAVWVAFTGGICTYPHFGRHLVENHPEELLISYGLAEVDYAVRRPFIRHTLPAAYLATLDAARYSLERSSPFFDKIREIWQSSYEALLTKEQAYVLVERYPSHAIVRKALEPVPESDDLVVIDPSQRYFTITVVEGEAEDVWLMNLAYEAIAYVKRLILFSANFLVRDAAYIVPALQSANISDLYIKMSSEQTHLRDIAKKRGLVEVEKARKDGIKSQPILDSLEMMGRGDVLQNSFIGSCGEMAILAYAYLRRNQDSELKVILEETTNHMWIRLCRGGREVICDPWKGDIFPAKEGRQLLRMPKLPVSLIPDLVEIDDIDVV